MKKMKIQTFITAILFASLISFSQTNIGEHLVHNSTNGIINWGSGGDYYFRVLSSQGNINTYSDRLKILNNGNVGIGNPSGNNMPNPTDLLHIRSVNDNGMTITQNLNGSAKLSLENLLTNGKKYSVGSTSSGNFLIRDETSSLDRFFIDKTDGAIGFNTSAPNAYLHINTPNNSGTGLIVDHNYTSTYGIAQLIKIKNDYTNAFLIQLNGATTPDVFRIMGNGQTRIGGKSSVAHPDAYLTVNGKIVCKDFYVTSTSDWPDYVFSKEYKLSDLMNVKEFYTLNQHLPGVPTAIEIKEKGINVGEITNIQMQKIEELTIYLIQLKEEIEALKKENEILKEKIK